MRKFIYVSIILGFMSSVTHAQDDMYFVPKKGSKKPVSEVYAETNTGCSRDIDEYNRRGNFRSTYYNLGSDSTSADVFQFEPGTYADTLYADNAGRHYSSDNDYEYSRRMSRFDGFYWYDPWYSGWYGPYGYGWPYRYSYYGWYDPWYDPWFYGWYRPWRYYGWYYPGYWHGGYHYAYGGITGTRNHGNVNYGQGSSANRSFRGYRGNSDRNGRGNRYDNADRNNSYNRNNFRGNRDNSFNNSDFRQSPSFNTGGSFGGNRGGGFSGGGSFGGSRGGGGGSFGGRR